MEEKKVTVKLSSQEIHYLLRVLDLRSEQILYFAKLGLYPYKGIHNEEFCFCTDLESFLSSKVRHLDNLPF